MQAVQALPPLVQQDSLVSTVLSVGFGLFVNLLFAFAVGNVIEQRLHLEAREAYTLGGAFYLLFLVSAISTPIAVVAYLEKNALTAPLLLVVLLLAWVLVVQQCIRRTRNAKQRIAA